MNIKNLPDDELGMIEAATAMCAAGMREEGAICPMLIMREDKTGELHTLNLTGAEKGQVGAIIDGARTLAAVLFVAEAWLRTIEAQLDGALAKAIKEDIRTAVIPAPRDCPDRREAVMVQFFHHARHIMLTAEIAREKGAKPTLGKWRILDNADTDVQLYGANFSPPGARLTSGEV